MPFDPRDPAATRTLSRNRCYLYVAPCAYEDLLKLGFSRDPLQRFQALHPRWYEFFDIERIALVETETVSDARALERVLKHELASFNTTVPLTVVREAGGHGEWYRGAHAHLSAAVQRLAARGYHVHSPAHGWLRAALLARRDLLYAWAEALLPPHELEMHAIPVPALRTARDVLDAFRAFDIALEEALPTTAWDWYGANAGR